jgi:hypothetical protein
MPRAAIESLIQNAQEGADVGVHCTGLPFQGLLMTGPVPESMRLTPPPVLSRMRG